jgi:hypothetical protein
MTCAAPLAPMRIAGVDQSVRMKISGHLTTSMDTHYDITDHADL